MNRDSTDFKEINKEIKKIRQDLREHNNKEIETVIENNKNIMVLKSQGRNGQTRIHQMKNIKREIKHEKNEIVEIVALLYKFILLKQFINYYKCRFGRNLWCYGREREKALSQLKNGRAPGENGIISEMLKMGGTVTIEVIKILINKCLQEGDIRKTWQNAQKGDELNLNNYRPISLLSHSYKLLTKVSTNRLTNKLDQYQSSE